MESNYINIIPEGETKTYNASQNDSGRTIRSELFEMPMAYTLDGSESIRLRYRKPDGSVYSGGMIDGNAKIIGLEAGRSRLICRARTRVGARRLGFIHCYV